MDDRAVRREMGGSMTSRVAIPAVASVLMSTQPDGGESVDEIGVKVD